MTGFSKWVTVDWRRPSLLTCDEDFAARFRREARVVASLHHPHMVQVYDFDTAEGLAFPAMEYLEGTTLKARLRDLDRCEELMPLEEVANLFDLLYHNAGRVCNKQEIAEAVWPEYQAEVYDYQIESLVKRLREKQELDPRQPVLLVTVRGRGYKLVWGESTNRETVG